MPSIDDTRANKDCGVYALHRLAGIAYRDARICLFHHGWSSTFGVYLPFLLAALEEQGMTCTRRKDLEGSSLEGTDFPKDSGMLAVTLNHVVPILDGRLENVNGCGRHKVMEVFSVERRSATDAAKSSS